MYKIDFGDALELQLPADVPPMDFTHGNTVNTIGVFVLKGVIEQINSQVEGDYKNETGGVLIGYPFININKPETKFTVITHCVPTQSSSKSRGHFTVSPDELIRVRTEIENKYSGLIVVGWYHSHPGLGVFLSSQDMQIIKSIYNAEWHIAYVVDHINRQHGFFYGEKGIRISEVFVLEQTPACVDAIMRYNIAVSQMAENDNHEAMNGFREWMLKGKRPELEHWIRKNKYQNVSLEQRHRGIVGIDEVDSKKKEIRRLIQQAELFLEKGPLYMVLPQIEQVLFLSLDNELAGDLSHLLRSVNRNLK